MMNASSECKKQKGNKFWHKYNEAFFQFKFLDIASIHKSVCNILTLQYRAKVLVHNYVNKSLENFKNPYKSSKIIVSQGRKEEVNVTEPNGWLIQIRTDMVLLHEHFPGWFRPLRSNFTFIWHCFLNRHIFTTIFFSKLFMPSDSIHSCELSRLNISSGGLQNFVFCGLHSSFSLFPPFNTVKTNIIFYPSANYVLKSFYTIIDGNMFTMSHSPKDNVFQSSLAVCCRTSQIRYQFLLLVHKLCSIYISVKHNLNTTLNVYDGPGFQAPLLVPANKTIVVSTFQCFVVLNAPLWMSSSQTTIEYLVHNKSVQMKHFLTTERKCHLELPPSDKIDSFFGVGISAAPGHQLKLGIEKINISTEDRMACNHGGLSIFEDDGFHLKEVLLLCDNLLPDIHLKRPVYSNAPRIIVFVFWYKFYSTISMTLSAQNTLCRTLFLNPCHVLTWAYQKTTMNAKSNKDITFYSVQMNFFKFEISSNISCFVLQIRRIQLEKLPACNLVLLHVVPHSKSNFAVMYNFSLFLPHSTTYDFRLGLSGHFQRVHEWWNKTQSRRNSKQRFKWNSLNGNHQEGWTAESFGTKSFRPLMCIIIHAPRGWSSAWISVKIGRTAVKPHPQRTLVSSSKDVGCVKDKVEHISEYSLIGTTDSILFTANTSACNLSSSAAHTIWMEASKEFRMENKRVAFGTRIYTSSIADGFEVSVPGIRVRAEIYSADIGLCIYFFHSRHKQMLNLRETVNKTCLKTVREDGIPVCFADPITLFHKYAIRFVFLETPLNWLETKQKCISLGGYMLYFFNKGHMEEFLVLIKNSVTLPYFGAIFIGHSTRDRSKVSVFVVW